MKLRYLFSICLLALAVGCAEDTDTDKGAEENPLTGGKDDSFFKPTEHGNLRFDLPNQASFNEDQLFHSWEFELTDEAKFDITTTLDDRNLDTLLYLYTRQDESESWGRYIKKNDDHKGNLWSHIALEGDAAQYRIIVKTLKSAMRGGFGVTANCEGAGCPAKDTCDNEEFAAFPRETGSSPQCVDDIYEVLSSAQVSESSGEVDIEEKCNATDIERLAVEYYHEWWDGIVGFDDAFNYDGDGVTINFYTTVRENGTVVDLDTGGDEDGITFVFDTNDRLLAMYQHNQSPTAEFYCQRQGEIEQSTPDADCFGAVLRLLPREETEREIGSTSTEYAQTVSPAMELAVEAFDAEFDVGIDEIDYTIYTWDRTHYEIELTHDLGEATYIVLDDYEPLLAFKLAASSGSEFICE